MNGHSIELVVGPLRQMRRSLLGWGIGLGALVAVTIAFWPAFRGSSGISEAIDQLPSGIVDAFGLAQFGTPAGFLRGNLYEFIVPLLLAVAAVAAANGLTAGEEDSGRMETYLSQPVTRQAVFLGRTFALVGWLVVVTVVILVAQLVSDAVFDLSHRHGPDRLDGRDVWPARVPVRHAGARDRGLAATTVARPVGGDRGRRWRLPRVGPLPAQRRARSVERPVPVEMGVRRGSRSPTRSSRGGTPRSSRQHSGLPWSPSLAS